MTIDPANILTIIKQFSEGWLAANGKQFAAAFSSRSRFVAFDGTVLNGPAEIANYHQQAFDSHLKGTQLDLNVNEIRPISANVSLVFAQGGISRIDGTAGALTGESVQTLAFLDMAGVLLIEAFQNTRIRPIIDRQSAQAWRRFDDLWTTRNSEIYISQ